MWIVLDYRHTQRENQRVSMKNLGLELQRENQRMSMRIDLQVLSSFDFIITTSTGDGDCM